MLRKSILPAILMVFTIAASSAQAAMPDFTDLVQTAGPAVVNINTEKVVSARRSPAPSPFFEEFFRGMPNDMFERFNQQPRQRKQRSLGSGFLISSDGYIVTNHHVIEGADSIKITFDGKDGKEASYKATVIGSDPVTDLALLKIDVKNLPYLTFGNSENLKVGQWVVAIGNPFGLDHTVTAGILSAKGRSIRSNPFDSFLQTDASINPGNSGGPLLNLQGEVIGINAAIIANGQGIGFAIPSNLAKEVIDKLRTDKKVSRGWIGVTIQSLSPSDAKALGLPDANGALIGDVLPGNPAAKGGMEAGDIILSINGESVADSADLSRKVAALKVGEKAKFTVWHNGSKKILTITIAERDVENAQGTPQSQEKAPVTDMLGMSVRPVTPEDAQRLRMNKAQGLLIVNIEGGKSAEEASLRSGDVIIAANGEPVNTVEELTKILETQGRSRGAVMFHIQRQGTKFFRSVEVAEK